MVGMDENLAELGGGGASSAALRNALVRAGGSGAGGGTPLTEGMVFLLAPGLGFHYLVVKRSVGQRLVISGTAAGVGWGGDTIGEVAQRLGLVVTPLEHAVELAADNALVEALDGGHVVVAWTDVAALPHRRFPPGFAQVVPHLLGVLGFDEANEEFTLDDGCALPVPIDATRLRLARAEAPGARNRALCLRAAPPGTVDVTALLRERIREATAAHLRAPLGSRGIAGMRALAAGLAEPAAPRGWLSLFGRGAGLFHALLALHRWIAHGDHGPAAGRGLWVAGLAEAATLPAHGGLVPELEAWRRIADGWTALAAEALPDTCPRLAEAREVLDAQLARYSRDGIDSMRVLGATSSRLAAIENEMESEFPLREADTYALLRDLGARVDALAAAELDSSRRLLTLVD